MRLWNKYAQTGVSDATRPDPTGDPASNRASVVGPLFTGSDLGRRRAGSPPAAFTRHRETIALFGGEHFGV